MFEEVESTVDRSVEQPTNQTERKHIATLHLALEVHAAVGKGSLHHRGHRHFHHLGLQTDFLVRIICLKEGFLEVDLLERVDINDSHTIGFEELCVLLKSCWIH